jgi:hypothetical protein
MCKECGCDKTIIGDVDSHTSGRPSGAYGDYKGVGGTNKGTK